MADRHKNRTLESEAQRKRAERDEAFAIDGEVAEARKRIDWKRRKKAEKSLAAWLSTYGIGVFVDDPPPKPHGVKILAEMEEAVGSSRPYQVLVARGGGKTSYTEAAVAYLIATGRKRFCLISSINAKQAQQILREITAVFTEEPFATDYPDISVPIMLLDGHGRRSQRYGGRDTKVRLVTDETSLPVVVEKDGTASAASGACIRAKALKSVRGTKNGTQRPDLVVLDDLQTREVAENEERVQDVLKLIRGDVMGLAGRGKASVVSTATTIAPDDVTVLLEADPAWKTTRNPAVVRWPEEWGKEGHGLWGEYFALFDEENANDMPHGRRGGSLSLYRRNRKAMDAGADILNWGYFDREGGQISGLQRLMDAYHQMGHDAFMAEYQMEPVRDAFAFELTARHILSRIRRGVPPKTIPPATVFTAAATDINPGYAITTAITTFDIRLTALVTAYHVTSIRIPENLNDTEFNARLFAALKAHAREIVAQGIHIDKWGIDAGGRQFNTVTAFAPTVAAEFGIEAVSMLGRAGQNWNPNVRSRIRSENNATILCRDPQGRRWLAWNADEYKEKMHRAWATEPGADGGLSIFDGNANHYRFAVQVANEKLKAKTRVKSIDGKERYAYKWQTKNPHDYGDCLAMCYALAGAEGLTGEGATMPKKKTRLAIGGKIVGAETQQAETGKPQPESRTETPETGTQQQLQPKKKHRLAIGGRLY